MKHPYAIALLLALHTATAEAQYCEPSFPNGCFLWRNQFISIGTLDWSIGDTDCSISDYTSLSTTVPIGTPVSMIVESGNWCGAAVWVDLDNSGSFEDAENLYYSYVGGDPSYVYDFNITIPVGTTPGAHRMRVVAPWGSDGFLTTNTNGFGPCGAYQYGNFNDFTLNVGSSIGIDEGASPAFSITAAPNPTEGTVYLTSGAEALERVRVMGYDGRVHQDRSIANGQVQVVIDLSELPSGVYFAECSAAEAIRTLRLVKE